MIDIYNFSHFIQLWIFPPGLILLILIIAYLLHWKWQRLSRGVTLFAIVTFWLISSPFVAQQLIDHLQYQYPSLIKPYPLAGAIVVLGSGIENAVEYKNMHALSDRSLTRLHYAAYLHKNSDIPIIVSGGNRDHLAFTEADLMSEKLKEHYQIDIIAMEKNSRTTADEARYLIPLLKQKGISQIILVTNAWHMPRSVLAFHSINVIPAPMGFTTLYSTDWFSNYLPSIKALNASVIALHEYVGLLWYRFINPV